MDIFFRVVIISTTALFSSLFCAAQNRETARIYVIVDWTNQDNAQGEDQRTTFYKYKNSIPVTLIEQYFTSKAEQEKRLKEIMSETSSCTKRALFDKKGGIVGSSYSCQSTVDGKPLFKTGYSYFDVLNKITIISAQSPEIIESFARGICPLADELYNHWC